MIKDAIIIIIISVIIALAFNAYSEKGIDLIRKPPEVILDFNQTDLEKTVSYDQVLKMLEDDQYFFIDARPEDLYQDGRIGEAINIYPLDEEEIVFEKIFSIIPEGKTYIIYCNGGTCDLSHDLAQKMIDMGFERIFIYHGGWDDWEKMQKG